MSPENIFHELEPVLTLGRNLDFSDPEEAEAWLEEAFPFDGPVIQLVRSMCEQGLKEGWLCRGDETTNIAMPNGPDQTFSLDATLMTGSDRPHRHPQGEIILCFGTAGDPTLDDRSPGWMVHADDTHHEPVIDGGTMLVLCMRPHAEVEWL